MRYATFKLRYKDATYYRVTRRGTGVPDCDVCILDRDGSLRYGPELDFPEASPEDIAAVSACQRREGAEIMAYFARQPQLAEAAYDMGLLPKGPK